MSGSATDWKAVATERAARIVELEAALHEATREGLADKYAGTRAELIRAKTVIEASEGMIKNLTQQVDRLAPRVLKWKRRARAMKQELRSWQAYVGRMRRDRLQSVSIGRGGTLQTDETTLRLQPGAPSDSEAADLRA